VNNTSTISALDWLPTLCGIAGVNINPNEFHGEDILDIWMGNDRSRVSNQYWERSMKQVDDEGEWRLYVNEKRPGVFKITGLYNLTADLYETKDLQKNPLYADKKAELLADWQAWAATLPVTLP
ncbi:MAG: hypothetical protein AAGA18_07770, partial [Verrucomicrobiota bacterium]